MQPPHIDTDVDARGRHSVNKGIPTLSLFSGAGGLDIGFVRAGFDILACVEINPAYCETLRANLGRDAQGGVRTAIHCTDVRLFDTSPYKNMGIVCVIGGPPCQTFSAAGRRAGGVIGTEDQRGQLFQAYCRILAELKPAVFVFENVYGLPGANGGGPWREIIKAFSALGYILRAEVVDAADYGVPQHRERLIMVGHREGSYEFPLPTHGPDSRGGPALVGVEEAIRDLQDPEEPFHAGLGGMYGHLLPMVPEGLNYSFFTAEMGHPEPQFAWRSKFHDLLYKVVRTQPCRTIKAQPGKFTGPFHWKNRHFTPEELKRLQTFPDNYHLVGTYGKVVEQIGNSVPPQLAYVIAASVSEQLLDRDGEFQFKIRPQGFRSTFRQRQRQRTYEFAGVAKKAILQQYGNRSTKIKAFRSAVIADRYMLNPSNLFDRTRYDDATPNGRTTPKYSVCVTESGSHIDITFIGRRPTGKATVTIEGLRKYLPEFDSLRLTAEVSKAEDTFHAWGAIEDALITRSRFFSLIDIYGHYANRGDVVNVVGYWEINESLAFNRAINLFSSSDACGDFLDDALLRRKLKVGKQELQSVVESMREIRFDVRSSKTHPIIGDARVLCTYPFPLLSPRALIESRALFSALA
jgi:DNA (cytosine-5)-methyltransferase 1